MKLAGELIQANKLAAFDLLQKQIPRGKEGDLRGWEWRYLWAQCRSDGVLFCERSNWVSSVTFMPGGTQLLIAELGGATALWDIDTKRPVRFFEQRGSGWSVAASPDGRYIAGTADHVVRLWEANTGLLIRNLETFPGSAQWLTFSPRRETLLASASVETGALKVRRVPSGDLQWEKALQGAPVGPHNLGIAFSPDGNFLAVGDEDGNIYVLNALQGGVEINDFHAHDRGIIALAFSPDGKLLASCGGYEDRLVKVWDLESAAPQPKVLAGHTDWISSLAFSPDGKILASASADQTVRMWRVGTWESQGSARRGHRHEILTLAFSPDGKTLVSGGKDGAVYSWNPAEGRPAQSWPRLVTNVLDLSLAPDATRMAVKRSDGSIALVDVNDSTKSLPVSLGTNNTAVLFSADGGWVVSGDQAGRIKVLDWKLNRVVTNFLAHEAPASPLRFAASGALLVTQGDSLKLWDTHTWALRATLALTNARVDVSPDGTVAAVVYDDGGKISFCQLPSGHVLGTVTRPHPRWGRPSATQFSPDGRILATGAPDDLLRLWAVPTGNELATIRVDQGAVMSIEFSPDGRRLISGASEGTALKIWDLATRRELLCLAGKGMWFHEAILSNDETLLAALNRDGVLYVWRAPSWAEIEAAEKRTEAKRR